MTKNSRDLDKKDYRDYLDRKSEILHGSNNYPRNPKLALQRIKWQARRELKEYEKQDKL